MRRAAFVRARKRATRTGKDHVIAKSPSSENWVIYPADAFVGINQFGYYKEFEEIKLTWEKVG